jgi:hypothetical protein
MHDWSATAKRNSRSVQTTIGWIFWDPGAVARFEELGLPGPLGYIAARCAPLAPAGASAVIAAFGSISSVAIEFAFALVEASTSFERVWDERNAAVLEGLHTHAPEILDPLADFGPEIWAIVDQLPTAGRVFFASHLSMPRSADPVLSGWQAINCLREWRGDTHWALVAASGLSGIEVSILHNEWMGYEADWLPTSRGSSPEDLETGWAQLEAKGLATGRRATTSGIELRQHLEDQTDRLTATAWEALGEPRSTEFAKRFEPPCEALLKRVDITAGVNYQPASRIR